MPVGDHTPRTYEPGDTVQVELSLADSSGVGSVSMVAISADGGLLLLSGHGGGQTSAVVTLSGGVRADTPPGTYTATQATVSDALGNTAQRTLSPALTFTIAAPVYPDTAAPTASGWGFA